MNTIPFHFFGPGLIVDASGHSVGLRSRKQLALLAYLATEHATVHSRETLLAIFWPDEETSAALNNLRVTLSRLRQLAKKLGPDGSPQATLLISDRRTVQIDPSWVDHADTNRFYRVIESSRQHDHASRNQCEQCQTLLRQAAQLYQGEFLDGFGLSECVTFEEWLFMQRERLRLLMLDAYADLAAYAENHGDPTEALDAARRQIELDPLRESAYRQQMRVLAKQNERNAALTIFERCRTVMRDELGLDPEPETLALHTQILGADMPSGADDVRPQIVSLEPHRANSVEPISPRYNLPQQLTPFIGREEEINALQARLSNPTYRLLSIVGPGGIGKSRLAQQVAAQQLNNYRDGVYFVPLAQVDTVSAIPLAIAETLGVSFGPGQKSPLEQLIEMIGGKHLLLVLDNFEHLMDGVEPLLTLLRGAPEAVLLVTSRERLNLQAEDLFELHGLAVPTDSTGRGAAHFAAVRLFVDRAHRLDKRFKLTDERLPHVVHICQLVEGFPLGIELAAAWIRDLTCEEIVIDLVDGLDRLMATSRDIDPQHRSLRAVFNASWRLLSTLERRTLAKLAVFKGGFTPDAAKAVADATPALLSALRNKSLLRHEGSRRYDMHALVHQFAAEALERDEFAASQAMRAHSQTYLTLVADQAAALDTRQAGAAGTLVQPDWENIVIAWQQATEHLEIELLQNAQDGLFRFCDLRGLYAELQEMFESTAARLDALAGSQTDKEDLQRRKLHCRLLTALVYVADCRSQFDRAQELTEKALAMATELGSTEDIISINLNQAKVFELVADYAQGMALAESMLEMAQAEGLERQAGICMELIGYNAYRLGDYGRSQEMYGRLLAFHDRTGQLELPARLAVSILGSMSIDLGRYETGLTYCQRFLASSQAIGDRVNTAQAYSYLANAWNHLGDYGQAIALAEQSIALLDILGDDWIKKSALLHKAFAHRQAGEPAEALSCVNEAVALAGMLDSPVSLAQATAHLAETQMVLAATEYEWDEAAANFQNAVARLRASDELNLAYQAAIGLSDLAYRRGDIQTAREQIAPILPLLPTETVGGWNEPIRAYVVCIEVLKATDDPAAQKLTAQGLHLLDCLAQDITDYPLRRRFLNDVPAHRELRMLSH